MSSQGLETNQAGAGRIKEPLTLEQTDGRRESVMRLVSCSRILCGSGMALVTVR